MRKLKDEPAKIAVMIGILVLVVSCGAFIVTALLSKKDKDVPSDATNNPSFSLDNSTEDMEPSGEDGTTVHRPTLPEDDETVTFWQDESTPEDFTMPEEGPLPTRPSNEETEPSGEDFTEPTEPPTTKPAEKPTNPTKPTEPSTTKPSVKPTEPPTTKPADPVKDAENKFKDAGGKYEVKSDGTVKITDGGNVKGALVVPTTIDGKKVTEIEVGAFSNNDNITSITVDCEVLGRACFQMCDKVTSVTIGPNVKEIEPYAFSNVTNLTSVTIQSNYIKDLKPLIFTGCKKLTSITLPASITRIAHSFIPLAGEWYAESMDDRHLVPAFTIYTYAKPGTIQVYAERGWEDIGLQYAYGEPWTYTDSYWDETRYVYEMGTDVEAAMNSYFARGNVTVVYK